MKRTYRSRMLFGSLRRGRRRECGRVRLRRSLFDDPSRHRRRRFWDSSVSVDAGRQCRSVRGRICDIYRQLQPGEYRHCRHQRNVSQLNLAEHFTRYAEPGADTVLRLSRCFKRGRRNHRADHQQYTARMWFAMPERHGFRRDLRHGLRAVAIHTDLSLSRHCAYGRVHP